MKKRLIFWLFIGLTLVNILIFLARSRFEYRPYLKPESFYGSCNDDCREKWENYAEDYPAEELKTASRILDTVVKDGSTTREQVIAIANFLRNRFADRRGVPSSSLLSRTPLGQFQMLDTTDNEKIWCGNWSNMFSFFCWSRGIPARIIEVYKPGDHHVLNEAYIPGDSNWGLVDLTNGLVLPSAKGKILTALDLLKKNTGSLVNGAAGSDSLSSLPDSLQSYYDPAYPVYYYNRYNLQEVYSSASRLKRYAYPDPWYEIADFENNAPGNFPFYLKISFIYLWIITGVFAFVSFFRRAVSI